MQNLIYLEDWRHVVIFLRITRFIFISILINKALQNVKPFKFHRFVKNVCCILQQMKVKKSTMHLYINIFEDRQIKLNKWDILLALCALPLKELLIQNLFRSQIK